MKKEHIMFVIQVGKEKFASIVSMIVSAIIAKIMQYVKMLI